jgi:uncharacterized protein (DUF169 family)
MVAYHPLTANLYGKKIIFYINKKNPSMTLWQATFYDQNEIILKAACSDLTKLMQPRAACLTSLE